jgi:hypothetical protein
MNFVSKLRGKSMNLDNQRIRDIFIRLPEKKTRECYSSLEIASYLDGLMSEKEREELELHLSSCDSCMDQVLDLRSILKDGSLEDIQRGRKIDNAIVILDFRRRFALAAAILLVSLIGYTAGFSTIHINRKRMAYLEMERSLYYSFPENVKMKKTSTRYNP